MVEQWKCNDKKIINAVLLVILVEKIQNIVATYKNVPKRSKVTNKFYECLPRSFEKFMTWYDDLILINYT
jgi:hypothetical protein